MKDPFEQFDLAPTFDVDLDDLTLRFQRLQRSLHPDRFVHEGAAARRLAANLAADAQWAFDLLSDDYRRALYLLARAQGREETAGDLEHETVDDPEFLATQFEWREQFEDLPAGDARAFADFAHRLRRARGEQLDALRATFDEQGRARSAESARLAAHRLRFFDRLLEDVERQERRQRAEARH